MESLSALAQEPLVAVGFAGFLILQLHHFARWSERKADVAWWRNLVEDATSVYLRATGKELTRLEPVDIAQIAAAAGCRSDVAEACLRDLQRRQVR